jgi:hypothetical protein
MADKKPRGYALPSAVRKVGACLLDVQMWCFGRDVLSQHGNLLLAYGFRRQPSPDARFRSRYEHDSGWQLWSWGLWISQMGASLYLPRQRFELFYMPCAARPQIWQPEHLPPVRAPHGLDEVAQALTLFEQLCGAVAAYEAWVQSTVGQAYRQQTIEQHPSYRHYRHINAESLVGQWQSISSGVHHHAQQNPYDAAQTAVWTDSFARFQHVQALVQAQHADQALLYPRAGALGEDPRDNQRH